MAVEGACLICDGFFGILSVSEGFSGILEGSFRFIPLLKDSDGLFKDHLSS